MPHTVLVVDDEEHVHELLRKALSPTGARILDAYDGGEALRWLATEPIDLLLTDYVMPGIDGLGLVRSLRETGTKRFPVIVITSMDESVVGGLSEYLNFGEGGRDHFVRKPFSLAELSRLFRDVLSKIESLDQVSEASVLSGDLETLDFLDTLQLIKLSRLTGTLHFSEPEIGDLHFEKGQLLDARTGNIHGRKAFFRMLVWTKGGYEFTKKSSMREERVFDEDTAALIMDGLAHLDAHRQLEKQIPERLQVTSLAEGQVFVGGEDELLEVVRKGGGLRAVLDGSPREDLAILEDLKALLDRGFVEAA